ncbi:hypothetical protein BGZ65_004216 [Modicella reniformis]|uniref:Uncharacterized protein n=1 Tax=Modicella reniformis TaxID=1440133 RepID=A0A9P6IZC6_9FUNG|nr:hypothetical protein BGZ65_004216 [Modicella reniformis]
MPPAKKAPSASASKGLKVKDKVSPYSKGGVKGSPAANKKNPHAHSKPNQGRTKHHNVNLTTELDSLLGDLNSQLQRKKTKRDARPGANTSNTVSESERKLNEAQAKHESLQSEMMSALNGISELGK